jgi:orotidine 5'-phosphate decarboxylase subfamily 2|tara:strand:+ start:6849 stop:7676 length:828 start_codon:yes stop_codon:yes gene_type:complete
LDLKLKFKQKLTNIIRKNNSVLSIGLDPDKNKMPIENIFEFNKRIIDSTFDLVCAYKPNFAFYEKEGLQGMQALYKTIDYIKSVDSDIVIIADAKRGDIGNTSEAYAYSVFKTMDCDAATINVYGGEDSVTPFVEYESKGVLIWCRASNPSSDELQNVILAESNITLYEYLGTLISKWNDKNNNIGLVAGATNIDDIKKLKKICPNIPFLVPGIGSQGGDLKSVINVLKQGNIDTSPYIINSSRSILYASNKLEFESAARIEADKFVNLVKPLIF